MTPLPELLNADVVLGEGSMYERLRRHPDIQYDPHIAHAGLIYHQDYARMLEAVHREYIAVARAADLPMLITASTHRATSERLARSVFSGRAVNQEHVRFVREIRDDEVSRGARLVLGATMSCKGDAYRPDEALESDDAKAFHAPHAEALAEGGAEVLLALTLPALSEALGLAQAIGATGVPYLIGFVVRPSGALLDGTPLGVAIDRIDERTVQPPAGYYVNCVHPSVCDAALEATPTTAVERVIGFKANTSALRPEELDGSEELLTEDPDVLAPQIAAVWRRHRVRIVGGCCGTGTEHIAALAAACKGAA